MDNKKAASMFQDDEYYNSLENALEDLLAYQKGEPSKCREMKVTVSEDPNKEKRMVLEQITHIN